MSDVTELSENQQRVVAEIQRIACELGVDRLSKREFDRHHRIAGLSTAGYQFGSWNAAVAAAGLVPYESGMSNRGSKISDAELLRDLLRVESELGAAPSERKVARFGSYSPKPYKERWGSVSKALAEAHRRYGGAAVDQ